MDRAPETRNANPAKSADDAGANPCVDKRPAVAGRYWPAVAVFLAVCVIVLAADQALKYYSFNVLVSVNPITAPPAQSTAILASEKATALVPGILSLRLTINHGAVFGLGQGGRWIFIIVSLVAVLIIGTLFYRSAPRCWASHIGLALILAGAIGNMWDRIVFGAVRDMLWLVPGTGLWPWIFNLADVSLLCGVAILLIFMWTKEKPALKKNVPANN